jgi:hypothetical protein
MGRIVQERMANGGGWLFGRRTGTAGVVTRAARQGSSARMARATAM